MSLRLFTTTIVFLAFCCGLATRDWTPVKTIQGIVSIKPAAGEISVETAISKCETFLKTAHLTVPSGVRLRVGKLPSAPAWYTISYPDYYAFVVECKKGAIVLFNNKYREFEYDDHKLNNKRILVSEKLDAQIRISQLAKKLGMSDSYELDSLQVTNREPGDGSNQSRYGYFNARYSPKRYGYGLDSFDRYTVRIDRLDGVLLSYSRDNPRPIKIESHTAKLSFDQAIEKANPLVRKLSIVRYRPGEVGYVKHQKPDPAKNSYLGYIEPNGVFGSRNEVKDRSVSVLRLAWVLCYPRDEDVWIDAADGTVLGGIYANN